MSSSGPAASRPLRASPRVPSGTRPVLIRPGRAGRRGMTVRLPDSQMTRAHADHLGASLQTGDTLNFTNQNGITGSYCGRRADPERQRPSRELVKRRWIPITFLDHQHQQDRPIDRGRRSAMARIWSVCRPTKASSAAFPARVVTPSQARPPRSRVGGSPVDGRPRHNGYLQRRRSDRRRGDDLVRDAAIGRHAQLHHSERQSPAAIPAAC